MCFFSSFFGCACVCVCVCLRAYVLREKKVHAQTNKKVLLNLSRLFSFRLLFFGSSSSGFFLLFLALLLALNLGLVETLDQVGDLVVVVVAGTGSALGRGVSFSKLAQAGEGVRAQLAQDTGNYI